jgi:hypothetical protein
MIDKEEHTCEYCYYDWFDSRAYPCSMCIYGEKRRDMFKPKVHSTDDISDGENAKYNLQDCQWK